MASRSYIILDCPMFRLETLGNGLAYVLTNKVEQMDCHIQGDEAHTFRNEMDAIVHANHHMSFEDVAAWLWDECGYGDSALPISPFALGMVA